MKDDDRLPVKLWIEGHFRRLQDKGDSCYVLHRGEPNNGVILLKIRCKNDVFLYQQERNIDGILGWAILVPKGQSTKTVEENWADAYIARAQSRDPDLWAVEIETRADEFPFEGPIFDDLT